MNFVNQLGQAQPLFSPIHVRTAPSVNAPIFADRNPGDTLEIAGYTTEGELANGSRTWFKTTGLHWVSATVVRFTPTMQDGPSHIPFIAQNATGTPIQAANVRIAPNTGATLVARRSVGETIFLSGYTEQGENVSGNSRWWRTTGGHWVSASVITVTPHSSGNGNGDLSINLGVPYHAQSAADAALNNAFDCGPACLHMVLHYLGVNTTTDEIFLHTGTPAGADIDVRALKSAAPSFGVGLDIQTGMSFEHVDQLLSTHRPVIALIHYGDIPLDKRDDHKFNGPHFVVIDGLTPNEVIYSDPDFGWGGGNPTGGDHLRVSRGTFRAAWQNASLDGADPFMGLVPDRGGA